MQLCLLQSLQAMVPVDGCITRQLKKLNVHNCSYFVQLSHLVRARKVADLSARLAAQTDLHQHSRGPPA